MSSDLVNLATLVKSQLEYPRGVLLLLKDTSLFGEPIQKALDELDALVNELESHEAKGVSIHSVTQ